ncbi:TonB-linked SusC/RagA family outer membrane protein [Pontibacter ummariensis]|uniref:TonB-linked outer membrane protein, SusC/RagA family n=1 Tax=Pontibacter ummariensis TaxID=1610492 RepID=A0A239L337_9BACT|nr:TonB-dependent receptor [Pontibacter ummariensis]PRY04317.1 TonB-linked SusC/RagA family outer membrane protein [Pontibacter ummariensis]SNT24871.1 TonB-linked outer membrane protein, SusC/RagA family [Pontibacter ummariensis]
MKKSTRLSIMLLMASSTSCLFSSQVLADSKVKPRRQQVVFSAFAGEKVLKQATTVQGKVTTAEGEPLPGVTVVLKGTVRGTTTGVDGSFSLNVPKDEGGTLVFSFIGYVSQEIPVEGKATINVVLRQDAKALEEVVVVGYGEQRKANLTGSVSTVSSEVLESRPVQNVGQALQGLIPGLNLQTTGLGGELNQPLNFNIRGAGTIGSTSSSPLVLIDGMEGDLNAINPQDIESVTVLKDAAASSIYGSRAPFGVILVTTKAGKVGKARVGYNNNFRLAEPMGLPTMMDSHTFAMYWNEAAANGGESPKFSQEVLDRILQYQRGEIDYGTVPNANGDRYQYYAGSHANTDWFKEQYKDRSFSQEHNVNLNGGTENTQFYVSAGYLDQGGLTRHAGDEFQRYTFTGKINTTISKLAKFNYTARYVREDFTRATHQTSLFYHNVARRWPTVPVKDPNGNWSDPSEIAQLREGGRVINQNDWIYQQAQLTLTPAKGWSIIANGNYRIQNRNSHTDVLPAYGYDVNGEPYPVSVGWNSGGYSSVSEYALKENYFSSNIYSDYEFNINDVHSFKVLGGFNSELTKYRDLGGFRSSLITPTLPTINTATEDSRATAGGYQHWAIAGFFARLNYNFKERYLLELNARYDGSSRFIEDKRWNLFPSVSAGWNVAQEDFWTIDDVIQMFKLRGSYGELGNQQTNNWYPFYSLQPISMNSGGWLIGGQKPNTAGAPGIVSTLLTWERVSSWNAGFDLAMLNNRLNLNFDYFKRKTFDMVGPAPELPVTLGTGVPQINNTDMESRGFEIEASWQDNIGGFNYGVRAVLADAIQEVTKYPNETGNLNQYYNGRKFGEIWGYTTVGIAKTQAEMDAHLENVDQSGMGSNWGAGDIMYADLNGDGRIDGGAETLDNPGDRSIIGNSNPRYRYSLDLTGEWRGFDVRVFMQGVGKRDYMPNGPYFWGVNGGMWQSAGFVEHMDFFRNETSPMVEAGVADINLDSYFPAPDFQYGWKNQQTQTRYLQNAAYLRLKNVQLGYSLPTSLTSKVGVSRVRIYVSGENLLTFSDMIDIFDPESVGLNGWNDGKTYPFARVFSFGLNLNL